MDRNAQLLATVLSAFVAVACLCAGLDAYAQPAPDPQPGVDAPHAQQLAWSLRHRVYRTQAMLDGSTAVWEYRWDEGETHAGPEGCPGGADVGGQHQCPGRRVSPEHQTYLAWLTAGHQPQALPAQQAPPRPTLSEAALQAQAQAEALADPEVIAARNLSADCLVDPANLSLVLQGLGGPCVALQEAYTLLRDTALAAALARLRAAYEVVP